MTFSFKIIYCPKVLFEDPASWNSIFQMVRTNLDEEITKTTFLENIGTNFKILWFKKNSLLILDFSINIWIWVYVIINVIVVIVYVMVLVAGCARADI